MVKSRQKKHSKHAFPNRFITAEIDKNNELQHNRVRYKQKLSRAIINQIFSGAGGTWKIIEALYGFTFCSHNAIDFNLLLWKLQDRENMAVKL